MIRAPREWYFAPAECVRSYRTQILFLNLRPPTAKEHFMRTSHRALCSNIYIEIYRTENLWRW